MSFGSLCFGLMRLNWSCLGTWMLLIIGKEGERQNKYSGRRGEETKEVVKNGEW